VCLCVCVCVIYIYISEDPRAALAFQIAQQVQVELKDVKNETIELRSAGETTVYTHTNACTHAITYAYEYIRACLDQQYA
jgi:hypothetical protein